MRPPIRRASTSGCAQSASAVKYTGTPRCSASSTARQLTRRELQRQRAVARRLQRESSIPWAAAPAGQPGPPGTRAARAPRPSSCDGGPAAAGIGGTGVRACGSGRRRNRRGGTGRGPGTACHCRQRQQVARRTRVEPHRGGRGVAKTRRSALLPFGRKTEQVAYSSRPPGLPAAATAPPASRPGGGQRATSSGWRSQRTSGWRRTMPEAVQGASSRMASKVSAVPPGGRMRASPAASFGLQLQAVQVLLLHALQAHRSLSSASESSRPAPAGGGLAAGGGAGVEHARRPAGRPAPTSSRARAGRRRPAPRPRPRRSRAELVTGRAGPAPRPGRQRRRFQHLAPRPGAASRRT